MPPAPKWTTEAARMTLEVAGFDVIEENRTKDGYGTVLRCAGGELVVVYDTGRLVVQGKRMSDTKPLFAGTPPVTWTPPTPAPAPAPAPVVASPAPKRASPTAPPIATSSGGAVRFVRDIPGPDSAEGIDLPW